METSEQVHAFTSRWYKSRMELHWHNLAEFFTLPMRNCFATHIVYDTLIYLFCFLTSFSTQESRTAQPQLPIARSMQVHCREDSQIPSMRAMTRVKTSEIVSY